MLILVLAAAAAYAVLRLTEPPQAATVESATTTIEAHDAEAVINEVGKYIVLPAETPKFNTVADAGSLRSQDFFKNAQNGDVVLFFPQANRGLLYRPSTHKVIEYTRVELK